MRLFVGAALLSLTSVNLSAATPELVQFSGSVQQDSATPVVFDLHVPSRQSVTLQLTDGSKLELSAPGSPESKEKARIRLLSPSGDVFHTATIPDPGLASTSFAYLVCDGQATYINPAPPSGASCSAP